jgi:hypothetical protein
MRATHFQRRRGCGAAGAVDRIEIQRNIIAQQVLGL